MKLHKIKQTLPEDRVEEILISLKIKYEKQVRFNVGQKFYLCDFKAKEKFIIEVQGDYWHGNPKLYDASSLSNLQKDMMERDVRKKEEIEKMGLVVIYIWEYDLIHNYERCTSTISELLL